MESECKRQTPITFSQQKRKKGDNQANLKLQHNLQKHVLFILFYFFIFFFCFDLGGTTGVAASIFPDFSKRASESPTTKILCISNMDFTYTDAVTNRLTNEEIKAPL